MCDVFEDHPQVVPVREQLFELIEVTPHLTWLLLTKRPENILRMLPQRWLELPQLPPNIWMGVTAEDQRRADERTTMLLQVPARVRFLSCEPLIGPIDLMQTIEPDDWAWDKVNDVDDEGRPEEFVEECELENDWINFDDRLVTNPEYVEWIRWRTQLAKTITLGESLDWVIVGGESGPGARPMHPNWARSLRDQCVNAGTKFFFKQWGEWDIQDEQDSNPHESPYPFGDLNKQAVVFDGNHVALMRKVGKHKAGRLLDGRVWDEMPEHHVEKPA
jgi:protein gp37